MKTGFTCGAFDLLHAGHVMMLEEAKSFCDYLIVGLQTNPALDRPKKNKPIQSISERMIQLMAIKYVDLILIYETEKDLIELLTAIKPDIRIVGADHRGNRYTGDDLCTETKFNSRNHNYSSSELRTRIKNS